MISIHRTTVFALLILVSLLAPACGLGRQPATPTLPASPTATRLPATFTPEPSPTPAARRVVLLAPEGADVDMLAALQPLVTDLAAGDGLRFQILPRLNATDLEDIQVVVALPPVANLVELVQAAPETQFLAMGIEGLPAADNLSAITTQGERPDQLGFLAGFVAASITSDWRVGVISAQAEPSGLALQNGFANGVTYFCGLCLPVYPPYPQYGYPIQVQVPSGAGPADWQAALISLQSWQVGTVLVDSAIAQEGLLAALAESDIQFILMGTSPAGSSESWVASLGAADLTQPVPEMWANLVSGKGGVIVGLPVGFAAVNPDLLSPGKQQLAEVMLAEMSAGFIDTGVDPLTGEYR